MAGLIVLAAPLAALAAAPTAKDKPAPVEVAVASRCSSSRMPAIAYAER